MQTTYKVGDKVRILNAKKIICGGRKWDDGDITTVDSLWSDGDPRLVITRGPEKGKAFVVDSSEFEYIEKVEESDAKMTQFKVGDKVRVINANASKHSNGDEGVVVSITPLWDVVFIDVDVNGVQQGHYAKNIELISSKPTKNQRLTSAEQAITTLEQKVEAMQAEIDALKAAQKATAISQTMTVKSEADIAKIAEGLTKMFTKEKKLSPNEQRKAIIDEAKTFVEATLAEVDEQMGWQTTSIPVYKEYGRLRIEFIVNAEKRTVVALARYGNIVEDLTVHGKGIAKCNPSDVFNADIGKAIALGRALGLDVSKFEKAAQPSEVVVGQVVDTYLSNGTHHETFKVARIDGEESFENYDDTCYTPFQPEYGDKIINDTEAQY